MAAFVPPVLDTTPYDRDQLAAIAEVLSRVAGQLVAVNLAYLDRVNAAIGGGVIEGAALSDALTAFAADMNAVLEASSLQLAAAAGEPTFRMH